MIHGRGGAARAGRSAEQLHRQALAETERGRHGVALSLLRMALRRDPEPVCRAHVLITLAYQEAERHSLAAGLALLETADAIPDLPARQRGLVASQRGLLQMRAGRTGPALASFDSALSTLDESVPEDLCRALLNRGIVHLQHRSLAQARADFSRCVDIAARRGLELLAAKASHNLGYLSLLAGDLPRALREMDAVAPALGGLSPPMVAVYYVDRAQVLLAAGLLQEADEDLGRAVELFRAGRIRQDQAEAELARAQVAVLAERWVDARRFAAQARRRFSSRGAQTWVLLAEQAGVAADVGSGRDLRAAAATSTRLAAELSAAGLDDEARRATLTAALASLGAGPAGAVEWDAGQEAAVALRPGDPIGTRLLARTVRAGLARAGGLPARADAELRAALRDLHRYQSSFGSMDLQTAVSGHGRRIAEQGLAQALATGRPAAVFGWAELARGLSARLAPVVPPEDLQGAGLLEELRRARIELREQQVAGRVRPALRSHCADLERRVRQRSWYRQGPGQTTAGATLAGLARELRGVDASYVAHLLVGQRVYALVAGPRRRALRDLGPADGVLEAHRRLCADLDALATTGLPAPIRATVRASARNCLAKLDQTLWTPLGGLISGGPVLLAPAAGLATLPWTLLPALYRRPVTVVGSATAWLARRDRAVLPTGPTVAVAIGPRVPRAVDEAASVAAQWSEAVVLGAGTATTSAVRDAARAVDILHVAAHGVHEPENPLFSYLEMADGPLFGHELDQLPRLPAHVVLSACDLGLSGARPGGETLGMTAALLHGGAGSVVAGVARISDAVACRVGAAHHAGLRRGLSPAAALAEALADWTDAAQTGPDDSEAGGDLAPLVCFGAGW